MSREKIKSKYGMSLQQPAPRPADPEPESWKDYASIVRLSEFIQANRHHGIHMIMKDGLPVLHFKPGLNKGSRERWDAALKAEILYREAIGDLMNLIRRKMIDLPTEAVGPSGDVEAHGSGEPAQSLLLDL